MSRAGKHCFSRYRNAGMVPLFYVVASVWHSRVCDEGSARVHAVNKGDVSARGTPHCGTRVALIVRKNKYASGLVFLIKKHADR